MNATAELIYPRLMRAPRTYNSQQFRMQIERLSLEELEKCIDKLTKSKEEHRDEKLRLCLRLRNAFLIQLPYFTVTKEYEDLAFNKAYNKKYSVEFHFINFKNEADIELFIHSIEDKRNDKSIIRMFILHENSIRGDVIRQYSKQYGLFTNICLKIKDEQYCHLVTRNRIQEMLYKLFTDTAIFPCVSYSEIIWTLQHGQIFSFGRYPESGDKPCSSIAETVKILLRKMKLDTTKNLTYWILIENNFRLKPSISLHPLTDKVDLEFIVDGINEIKGDGCGDYCFMANNEMEHPFRVSILASK